MDFPGSLQQRGWTPPPFLLDGALALLLTVIIQAEVAGQTGPSGWNAVALLITVPLVWRRLQPLPVFVLVALGVTVTFTNVRNSDPLLIYSAIVAIAIAAYSVGIFSRQRALSPVVLVATAT